MIEVLIWLAKSLVVLICIGFDSVTVLSLKIINTLVATQSNAQTHVKAVFLSLLHMIYIYIYLYCFLWIRKTSNFTTERPSLLAYFKLSPMALKLLHLLLVLSFIGTTKQLHPHKYIFPFPFLLNIF